jgi:hypothetical protein
MKYGFYYLMIFTFLFFSSLFSQPLSKEAAVPVQVVSIQSPAKAKTNLIRKSTSASDTQTGTGYQLYQNYPNPFNPVTNINFYLPERSYVKLTVFNLLGLQVAQLVNESIEAGTHTVTFDGSDLAGGIYFYKLETGKFIQTRKLTLLK